MVWVELWKKFSHRRKIEFLDGEVSVLDRRVSTTSKRAAGTRPALLEVVVLVVARARGGEQHDVAGLRVAAAELRRARGRRYGSCAISPSAKPISSAASPMRYARRTCPFAAWASGAKLSPLARPPAISKQRPFVGRERAQRSGRRSSPSSRSPRARRPFPPPSRAGAARRGTSAAQSAMVASSAPARACRRRSRGVLEVVGAGKRGERAGKTSSAANSTRRALSRDRRQTRGAGPRRPRRAGARRVGASRRDTTRTCRGGRGGRARGSGGRRRGAELVNVLELEARDLAHDPAVLDDAVELRQRAAHVPATGASIIAPSSSEVVVLPFVPVTATSRASGSRR